MKMRKKAIQNINIFQVYIQDVLLSKRYPQWPKNYINFKTLSKASFTKKNFLYAFLNQDKKK
jgi:hypothetical protein